MKTTIQWLDQAKEKHSLSDYALAPRLGVGRGQISRYRNGQDFLSDDAAIKLAGLLEIEPGQIIASAHAERSKSEEARAFWSQWAEKLGSVAVSIMLMAGLGGLTLATPDAQAAGRYGFSSKSSGSVYTLCKTGKRRRRRSPNPFTSMCAILTAPPQKRL